ncbi:hypothethical protein [Ralstonia solanacearum PSI07]|nr:hypothethical protein [Ralstonia solanacearum PSI07]
MVALTIKRPLCERYHEVEFTVGSHDWVERAFDVSGPARGVLETGLYQSPLEDGMRHFHAWYRRIMGACRSPTCRRCGGSSRGSGERRYNPALPRRIAPCLAASFSPRLN